MRGRSYPTHGRSPDKATRADWQAAAELLAVLAAPDPKDAVRMLTIMERADRDYTYHACVSACLRRAVAEFHPDFDLEAALDERAAERARWLAARPAAV